MSEYLTKKQIAKALGTTPAAITSRMKRGKFPEPVGRGEGSCALLWKKQDLAYYFDNQIAGLHALKDRILEAGQ